MVAVMFDGANTPTYNMAIAGNDATVLIIQCLGLGLVSLSSLYAFYTQGWRLNSLKEQNATPPSTDDAGRGTYEDKDGAATRETQQQFSTSTSRLVGLAASLLGLVVAAGYAVVATVGDSPGARVIDAWLLVASWALLAVQGVCTFAERRPVVCFHDSIWASISCLIIGVALLAEHESSLRTQPVPKVLKVLAGAEGVLLLIALLGFVTVQRRPELAKDGKQVDGYFTTSLWGKMTFAWAASVLKYAGGNKTLELDEIPKLSAYQRSQVLETEFEAQEKPSARLWKGLLWRFRAALCFQCLYITIVGITQFGPQYAMLRLLRLLEDRQDGAPVAASAWVWVLALGALMVVTTVFESWLFFIVMADTGMPIRSLLSILVFSKATRRKDVKGDQKRQKEEGPAIDAKANDGLKAGQKDGEDEDDEDDSGAKSRQSTVNLVGVDAKRVSDFCSFLYLYPGVVVKLIVSMIFLLDLIGWKSLTAGLVAFSISIPFNIILSKLYTKAQDKLMKQRDSKLAIINEVLQGIRQIKFSAIERRWEAKIGEKRIEELKTQWRVFLFDTGLVSLWIFGPVMLSAVCLTIYTVINGSLSPSIAFTTIAVLSQIEVTLAVIPELTADALEAWIALERIEKFLKSAEKVSCLTPSDEIAFKDATVAWPADDEARDSDRFTLSNLNIAFPSKELSVVSGKTGGGKSLLLAALLGEVDLLKGSIEVPKAPSLDDRFDHRATPQNWIIDSALAFVAQIPWIENATIKDNILFGLPFEERRYEKTLQVCALEKDLDILPDGDRTDIGANGINLSGGQRWRVTFARAMYSRAGILVLDDIFSAVDAHVGRQLFEDALTGELGKGRTRILVTHHVGLCLPRTKYLVHLADGTVQHAGTVEELKNKGDMDGILKSEMMAIREEQGEDVDEEEEEEQAPPESNGNANGNGIGDALIKMQSHKSTRSAKFDEGQVDTKGKDKPKKFIEDEKRETGGIKIDIYWEYIKQGGGLLIWLPLMLAYVGNAASSLGRSYWVTIWTRSYETKSTHAFSPLVHAMFQTSMQPANQTFTGSGSMDAADGGSDVWYWLSVYLAFSLIIWIVGSLKYFMSFIASIRASRKLFDGLSYTVLRAPLRWLDTVPVGRVLNRFTADFNVIDSRLAGNMGYFFYQALEMIAITIAGFLVSPFMVPLALVLFAIAFMVMLRYLAGAREVKRLESNAKSPIFEQFGALLSGLATVRAFDKSEVYIRRMYEKIDLHGSSFYHIWLFNRWMGFRLSITGTAFAVAVAIVIVATDSIDAALAGFALNFALRYSSAIIWTMRGYAGLEMDLNAVERVVEYTRLETEDQTGHAAPAAWPTSGHVQVDDLVAGYAPDLPPVLKGLTFSVEDGQRVGVVGRTGAGKSSLTLALFRFLHAREGRILIDGLDVSTLKLHDLRSRLAIIPQDPVLFSGTVRSNLDAFDEHSDAALENALQRVHLIGSSGLASRGSVIMEPRTPSDGATAAGGDGEASTSTATSSTTGPSEPSTNTNVFRSLSSTIAEGGLNLSQGQRQLLCLARAIVARPKLMVLDEATSAVDMATDELIQRSIREEFEGSTLLVIAHRLSTIADFDRILVMADGKAVEFGTPRDLWERQAGVFRGMVLGSGERAKLERMILEGDR